MRPDYLSQRFHFFVFFKFSAVSTKKRMALESNHLLHQETTSNDPQWSAAIQKALQRSASFYNNRNIRYHKFYPVRQSSGIQLSSFLKNRKFIIEFIHIQNTAIISNHVLNQIFIAITTFTLKFRFLAQYFWVPKWFY